MSGLTVLLVCFLAGVLLRQTGRVAAGGHVAINAYVTTVALPALTFVQLHGMPLPAVFLGPILMPWAMFGIGAAFFHVVGTRLGYAPATKGALILCGGLANTSFVGLPMIEAFYGPEWLKVGVLMDQLGTFLALSTLGILAAASHASRASRPWFDMLRSLLVFPPFVAMLVSLTLLPMPLPEWLLDGLRRLGATVVPLALCSVGLQMNLAGCRAVAGPLALGLGFKLVLAPAVLLIGICGLAGVGGDVVRVGLFETTMAPQIGAAMVAMDYGLDARLITAMVGFGLLLSFATAPTWWWVLSWAVP